MNPPAFTYPAFTLPAPTPTQAIHGADKPVFAMVTALAAVCAAHPLGGAARNLAPQQQFTALLSSLREHGITDDQADLWSDGIACARRARAPCPAVIAGMTLSQYQRSAVDRLGPAGGILNMAIGLGKTATASAAAIAYTSSSGVRRASCWIVCPLTAFDAWNPYLPALREAFDEVRVLSIDSAHKFVGRHNDGGVLIIDEAHHAGHIDARRTKALFTLRLSFDVGLMLTGTLLHGGVSKALNVLSLAIPGASPFATKWSAGEYFHCLARKQIGQRKVVSLEKPSADNQLKLFALLSQYTVAMTKHTEEVRAELTIPEQILHTVTVGQRGDESIDDCIVRLATAELVRTGELPHASAIAHLAMREGAYDKLCWLYAQMADDDTPVAVFAQYRDSLDAIEGWLKDCDITHGRVDGDVVGEDRAKIVGQFQMGHLRVFLGQMEAAGLSINLFRTSISVAFDFTQRPEAYAQMLGRTCRRGQLTECNHFDLVANPIQALQLSRLRAGEAFHLGLVNFQAALQKVNPCPTPSP